MQIPGRLRTQCRLAPACIPHLALLLAACTSKTDCTAPTTDTLEPRVVTPRVPGDADDPAIWLDPADPSRSLVLGTDKVSNGSLFAFDLSGAVVATVTGLDRPNNVDVQSDVVLAAPLGRTVVTQADGVLTTEEREVPGTLDVAVVTERGANRLRIFSLPDLAPVDNGGIEVFVGDAECSPMGIALYRRPADGAVFAIVSRKSGPTDGYLKQYRLVSDGFGAVELVEVRAFGTWSGRGEIEAVAVDDALGYVYYSDELVGVRKYHADPDVPNANDELALFGTSGFGSDREGISIYTIDDGTGYVLVSDQQCGQIQVFPREGTAAGPHDHPRIAVLDLTAEDSDGNEVTNAVLDAEFPAGLFVAMSNDRTFQLYGWPDLAGTTLAVAPDGAPPRSPRPR